MSRPKGPPVGVCVHCATALAEREPGERIEYAGSRRHGYCALLHIVGHDVGLCGCTGYEGLGERAAAIECHRRFQEQQDHEPF